MDWITDSDHCVCSVSGHLTCSDVIFLSSLRSAASAPVMAKSLPVVLRPATAHSMAYCADLTW